MNIPARLSTQVSFKWLATTIGSVPRMVLGVATASLLVVGLPKSPAYAQEQSGNTDDGIVKVIEREFLRDDVVPFNRIAVTAADGVVTLQGAVTSIAAKRYAEKRASLIRGVVAIVNRIEVAPRDRLPAAIAASVRAALDADPATDNYEVDVAVDTMGIVTLTGEVDSQAEKVLVEDVTTTVAGVTALDNRLTVADPRRRFGNEAELAEHIRGRLRWDVRVDDSLIRVLGREGGRILISGTVGSLAEKNLAVELAWVAGVRSVEADYLEVEPWARDEDLRRGMLQARTDAEIRMAVMQAFSHDPRVFEAPIAIDVDGGSVWLRGSVDNLRAKRAAERDAMNTVGVVRVQNHLKVQPDLLTDEAIAELVRDGLRGAGLFEDNDIDVTVTDGFARLTGDVGSTMEYWRAAHVASATRGLEELQTDLTIRGRMPMMEAYRHDGAPDILQRPRLAPANGLESDRTIYDTVASELFWSPFVDSDDVRIDVDDGIVTLSGTVESTRERRAARDNALEGGALFVDNELVIAGE